MHVDGGVTRQIYVNSVNLPFKDFDKLYSKPPQRYLYLVHNGKLDPDYGAVKPSTFEIASQSISALMLYQHKGDNYRIYRMAKDAGADFNSIAVPHSFTFQSKEKFDLNYQKALFEQGFELGRARRWQKAPDDVPEVRSKPKPVEAGSDPGRSAAPCLQPPPATPDQAAEQSAGGIRASQPVADAARSTSRAHRPPAALAAADVADQTRST